MFWYIAQTVGIARLSCLLWRNYVWILTIEHTKDSRSSLRRIGFLLDTGSLIDVDIFLLKNSSFLLQNPLPVIVVPMQLRRYLHPFRIELQDKVISKRQVRSFISSWNVFDRFNGNSLNGSSLTAAIYKLYIIIFILVNLGHSYLTMNTISRLEITGRHPVNGQLAFGIS